eukprot:1148169-Pelagomonas_calceolata.AAC.8
MCAFHAADRNSANARDVLVTVQDRAYGLCHWKGDLTPNATHAALLHLVAYACAFSRHRLEHTAFSRLCRVWQALIWRMHSIQQTLQHLAVTLLACTPFDRHCSIWQTPISNVQHLADTATQSRHRRRAVAFDRHCSIWHAPVWRAQHSADAAAFGRHSLAKC